MMIKRLPNLIGLVLAAFPIILWGFILPSNTGQGIFINPRLVALYALLLFIFFVSLFSKNSLMESLRSLRHLPAYFYALAAYLAIVCLSSITSPNPGIAWFGLPTSQEGALYLIALALLFACYARFRVPGLMRVFAVITFAASLLTLAQFLGFRPLGFLIPPNLDTAYPIGTTAYRGHLAGLFAFLSLLPLYAFYSKPKTLLFWLWLVSSFVGLALTTNTSAIIACSVCLAIYLAATLKLGQLRHGLVVALIFAASIYAVPKIQQPVNTFLVNHHLVAIALNSSGHSRADSFGIRLLLWKAAFRMWQAKPWLGWGDQQFNANAFAFLPKAEGNDIFQLQMGLDSDTKITRIGNIAGFTDAQGVYGLHRLTARWPHNIIMEQLEAHGILGLLAYLTFFVTLLWSVFLRHKGRGIVAALPYFSYFIYLTAWFYTVSVAPLAWIMLGAIIYDLRRRDVPVKVPAATNVEADATLKPAGVLGTLSSAE